VVTCHCCSLEQVSVNMTQKGVAFTGGYIIGHGNARGQGKRTESGSGWGWMGSGVNGDEGEGG
jgi:hypothetical protein